jgi:hypothetical protein
VWASGWERTDYLILNSTDLEHVHTARCAREQHAHKRLSLVLHSSCSTRTRTQSAYEKQYRSCGGGGGSSGSNSGDGGSVGCSGKKYCVGAAAQILKRTPGCPPMNLPYDQAGYGPRVSAMSENVVWVELVWQQCCVATVYTRKHMMR